VLAQVLELEARPEQPPRRVGNHHLAGRRDPLQARCKVRGVTDYGLLLRRTLADQVADDHEAGRDRDPRARASPAGLLSLPVAAVIASPARTARSASSSCARGQPK
jgi:hypothetical protein